MTETNTAHLFPLKLDVLLIKKLTVISILLFYPSAKHFFAKEKFNKNLTNLSNALSIFPNDGGVICARCCCHSRCGGKQKIVPYQNFSDIYNRTGSDCLILVGGGGVEKIWLAA